MKKILSSLIIILFLSSCEDRFLDLSPISQANVNDFYKNPSDILNGVNAAYASLQNGSLYGGRDFMDMTEYRADNTFDNDPSANSGLRALLYNECKKFGIQTAIPRVDLCTDNAAMIGFLAEKKLDIYGNGPYSTFQFTVNSSALRANHQFNKMQNI
jgi:hypothetical protein